MDWINNVWNSIIMNQDHFWYALSGIGAIGTLIIARNALNTWQKEKEYDLIIENLTFSNTAVEFIDTLRYPVSSTNEINKEYLEEFKQSNISNIQKRRALESLLIYQSRRDRQQDIIDNVLQLREKNWAVYGEKHHFYLFFNHIADLDNQIKMAHIRYYQLILNRDDYSDDEFKAITKEVSPIMYSTVRENDPIVKELNDWIDRLKLYRIKK